MKRNLHFFFIATFAASALAQVKVIEQESADKTRSRTEIVRSTMDRTDVPLAVETKETKVDANTKRYESTTQVRLNDGTYAPMQRTATVERKVSPTLTEFSSEVQVQDRQGGIRQTRQVNESITKTVSGEQSKTEVYQRDSSGQLVLQDQTTAVTTKNADGTVSKVRVENGADINGKFVSKQQVEELITKSGSSQEAITRNIKSVDHLTGNFTVTAKETETIQRDGNTTRTETVTQKPGRTGWEVVQKTTTTETRAPDGSMQRETIEQERSLFTTRTGDSTEPLVPKRKIVEREVNKPGGTTVLQRDVLYRDVNGDWKPASFSLAVPGASESKGGGN
jgi:hypothetical protein